MQYTYYTKVKRNDGAMNTVSICCNFYSIYSISRVTQLGEQLTYTNRVYKKHCVLRRNVKSKQCQREATDVQFT